VDLIGENESSNLEVSESAEEVGRRREAEDSSYAECRRKPFEGPFKRKIILKEDTIRVPIASPQSFLCFFVSRVSCVVLGAD